MNDQPEDPHLEAARAPLLEHLTEFRTRLLRVVACYAVATIGSYFFAADIYAILVEPLAHTYADPSAHRLIYTGLTEAFFTYLQLACFSGFVLTFPMLAWQLYGFLAPGLYRRERRALVPFLLGAPVLFGGGAALAYYVVLPGAWKFFLSFEKHTGEGSGGIGLPIQLEARVEEYLGLVMHIILAFGIAFQLPVILALLVTAGFLTAESLARARRYALVGIVVFAGVVTPPDVFSQIALAVPMYGLYELSILACRAIERRRLAQTPDVFVP